MNIQATPQLLAGVAGAILSLILMLLPLIPTWKVKWDYLAKDQKQAINVLLLMLVTAVMAILSCFTDIVIVECTQVGMLNLVLMFASAAIGNAGTYVTVGKLMESAVNKFSGG